MASEFTTACSGIWKLLNTGLGAEMGATALGSKTSEQKVREIIREELGGGRQGGRGYGYGINDTVVISQPCSDNTSVNRFELGQSQRISEFESTRETDTKILDVWKASAASDQRQDEKFAQLTKSLTDYVIENNHEVDTIKRKIEILDEKIDCVLESCVHKTSIARTIKQVSSNKIFIYVLITLLYACLGG